MSAANLTLVHGGRARSSAALADAEARAARIGARVTRPGVAPGERVYAVHASERHGVWLLQQARTRPLCDSCGDACGELAWFSCPRADFAPTYVACDVLCIELGR